MQDYIWVALPVTRVRLQQLQEQHHPFLPGCAVFFMCPNNSHTASVWDFSVHTDGGHSACNCTQGLYDSCERVCTESWLSEEKSLAEPGNRTCVSTGPGVLVQRSTSRAIMPLSYYRITQRDKGINTNRWLVNAKTLASHKLSTAKVTLWLVGIPCVAELLTSLNLQLFSLFLWSTK